MGHLVKIISVAIFVLICVFFVLFCFTENGGNTIRDIVLGIFGGKFEVHALSLIRALKRKA